MQFIIHLLFTIHTVWNLYTNQGLNKKDIITNESLKKHECLNELCKVTKNRFQNKRFFAFFLFFRNFVHYIALYKMQ